jgi:DNA-binding CsgD family transcriptional regulator
VTIRAITIMILLNAAAIWIGDMPAHAQYNLRASEIFSASSGSDTSAPETEDAASRGAEDDEERKRRERQRQYMLSETDLAQDWVPWGVLVVDSSAAIVFANERAQGFLTAGCGMEEREGRLYIQRSNVNRALQLLIRSVTLRTNEDHGVGQWSDGIGIPDQKHRIRYAARVLPMRDNSREGLALITVSDLVEQPLVRRGAIRSTFNLSEREGELAELFSNGFRLDEIAQKMGISMSTARVHLRHVFRKTGCSDQIHLARTISLIP